MIAAALHLTNFEDFCTWMYVIVDDIWYQIAPLFKRPSPTPLCSDSSAKGRCPLRPSLVFIAKWA